jgi:branched-chain amino acid transport system permease protein
MTETRVKASGSRATASKPQLNRRTGWRYDPRVRNFGACMAGAVVLAMMTGTEGNKQNLWFGIKRSILDSRIVYFLLIGVAVWALLWFKSAHAVRIRKVTQPIGVAKARGGELVRLPVVKYPSVVVFLVFAIVLPLVVSNYWNTVLVNRVAIFMLLALGLNVVVGMAGLLDLGYIAFYAIGAYTTAYFTGVLPIKPPDWLHLNPFAIIPIAVVLCCLSGVILGAPVLRLRGDYLAIVTLGFGEIIRIVAENSEKYTYGSRGVTNIPHPSINLFGIHYKWGIGPRPYYYLVLALIVIVFFLFRRLEHSRVGRAWVAIREDEVAAASNGIPVVKFKILAFAIGASTSGLAGVIYASKVQSFSPPAFLLLNSILILVLVVFGGMGSQVGVVVGAALLMWLPEALKDYVPAADRYMYFGALLIVMMIFRPQGVIPEKRRARELGLAEAGIGHADAMSEPPGGAVR